MNALIENLKLRRAEQRRTDGERLMQEFLEPAKCTICAQPRVVVETARVPQLEDEKICAGCSREVAEHSSRFNLPIHRAIYELRALHGEVRQ